MKLTDATPIDLIKIIKVKEVSIRKLRQKNTRLAEKFRRFKEENEEFTSHFIQEGELQNKIAKDTITEIPDKENESPLAASFVTAEDGDSNSSEPSQETEDPDKRYADLLQHSKNTCNRLDKILQKAKNQNTVLWNSLQVMLWEALKDTPGDTLSDPADVTIGLLEGPPGFAQQDRMKAAIFRAVREGLKTGQKATRSEDDALWTDNMFNAAADILVVLRKMSNTTL